MSQPTRIPPRRKSKGDGQFMFSALLIVIVIACLLGMYFYIEEQKNFKNSNNWFIKKDSMGNDINE